MTLLVDMNLSPRLAALLVEAGFPATHWSEIGPVDAADTEIMTYAKAHDFVVLTHDLDYSAIPAATKCGQAKRSANPRRRPDARAFDRIDCPRPYPLPAGPRRRRVADHRSSTNAAPAPAAQLGVGD